MSLPPAAQQSRRCALRGGYITTNIKQYSNARYITSSDMLRYWFPHSSLSCAAHITMSSVQANLDDDSGLPKKSNSTHMSSWLCLPIPFSTTSIANQCAHHFAKSQSTRNRGRWWGGERRRGGREEGGQRMWRWQWAENTKGAQLLQLGVRNTLVSCQKYNNQLHRNSQM